MSKEGQNKYSVALGSIPTTQKLPGGFTAPLTISPTAVEKKFLDTYERSSSPDAINAVNYFNEDPDYIGIKIQKRKEFPSGGEDIEKIYSEIKPNKYFLFEL